MKVPFTVAAAVLAVAVTLLPASSAFAQGRAVARSGPAVHAVAVARPAPYYRPYSNYRPYPYYPYYGGYYPYYGSSFWFGYGYPGYPYYPYWSYPAPYGYGYSGSSLRLQVTPRTAEVFVDGYYAGKVDDFDGTFQRLRLEPGQHTVQLYMAGHRTVQQELYLQPGNTVNVRTTLDALAPGEPEPVRPMPSPASEGGERGNTVTVAPRPLPGTVPGELGTLAIRVRPGDAMVTIDGERWDSSADADRLTVALPPGLHHVEIVKDGYRWSSADVTLRPGQTEALNVSLAR